MNEKAIATRQEGPSTELAVKREAAGFAASVRNEVGVIAGIDDGTEYRYRFPRLGKLHLGVKRTSPGGKEYPSATDYFVLPDELVADEKFMAVLAEHNADVNRPRKLPIRLVSHNIIDNVRSSLDLYGSGRGLKCRSWDGLVRNCVDERTGEIVTDKCTNKACPLFVRGDCQVITRLRFFLPDAVGVGVWQLDTRSVNNRANLPCEMQTLRSAMGGKLGGIDLWLTLEPEEKLITLTKNGQTQQIKKDVWLLHLRTDLTLRELAAAAAQVKLDYAVTDIEEMDTSYDDVVMEHEPDNGDFEVGEPDEPEEEPEAKPEPAPTSNGTVQEDPESAEETGAPVCTCGQVITDNTMGGKSYTASQIVDATIAKTGRAMCVHCFIAWQNDQRKAAKPSGAK